jgi:hypothetical protein
MQAHANELKGKISDVIVVLLQHGADPTGTVCISNHIGEPSNRNPCNTISLKSVLGSITSRNSVHGVQILPAVHTMYFDRDTIRRVYMLRAMASWKVAVRNGCSISKGGSAFYPGTVAMFLQSFIANREGLICSACAKWHKFNGDFAAASCLDCNGRYYLCETCVQEQSPKGPIHSDVLSQRLVHERPSSAAQHTHFSFGRRDYDMRRYYGVETALSVLEDWYSRNTNGVDAALD